MVKFMRSRQAVLPDLKILGVLIIGIIRVTLILVAVSAYASVDNYPWSKLSAYECGFQVAGRVSAPFTVSYFLVALVFVVFDVEILFLFPFIEVWNRRGSFSLLALAVFIRLLVRLFIG